MSQDNQTEEPTEQKLRDAVERGNVAKSRDLSANATMAGWTLVLVGGGTAFFTACCALVRGVMQAELGLPWASLWARWAGPMAWLMAGGIVLPVAVAIVLGALPELMQTRMKLAVKKDYFSLASLNPVEGFKKLFSLKQLVTVPLSALRFACMAWVAWRVLRGGLGSLDALWHAELPVQLALLARLVVRATLAMMAAIVPLSLADWAWQRFTWKRGLRMSKEELKREFKDAEGDPHTKGQRKQLHTELVR